MWGLRMTDPRLVLGRGDEILGTRITAPCLDMSTHACASLLSDDKQTSRPGMEDLA